MKRTRRYVAPVDVRSGDRITVEWFEGAVRYTASGVVWALVRSVQDRSRIAVLFSPNIHAVRYQEAGAIYWPNTDARIFLDEAQPAADTELDGMHHDQYPE